MGKITLTKCDFCYQTFGVDTQKYKDHNEDEYFKVNCPYCREENTKRGMKHVFSRL